MKRKVTMLSLMLMLLGLTGCNDSIINNQYDINTVFGYSSFENDTNKTEVSYQIDINGTIKNIANVKDCELVISSKYDELVLNKSNQKVIIIAGQNTSTLRVEGTIVFNTKGMSKEDITKDNLFECIRITDESSNKFRYELK